ncbi:hypothetical protein [Planococcus sp. 107-1]|uniref:hypothetical protein n=1 Tax=Planococcus sp. 107-1 TaxID=2908840 RepID=UPI001F35B456|nr:hypothetical protein [Planococcus sp. 107-1]UJF27921.1 hypothetical protein L0M13_05860 [Planococcus sp. 107-1]
MSFIAKATQQGINIIKNDTTKKLGEKVVKEVAATLALKGARGAENYVIDSSRKALSNKKELELKYENTRKILITTSSDLESFSIGIEEASNMVNYYQYDLTALNKVNPAYLVNYQRLTQNHKKWKTLLTNLRNEAFMKITKEATIVFESKKESKFFSKFPEINSELISIESKGDLSKVLLKINKHYLKDFKQA